MDIYNNYSNEYKNRTAVYLRKSRNDSPDETTEETLSRHLNQLTEFAVKNNITIIRIYKEVVSGDGLFTRPKMIELLNDIEQGLYTAVLCVDIDRLGRSSTKDSGIIIETLQDNNCRIITLDKTYDLKDDTDEMTVELKTFFARQELRSIRKRLQRGEIETIKSGGHTGEPPYGYRRLWLDKTPTLEPTEEAANVRMIYNWYINDGYGSQSISQKLNAMGIAAPDGGKFSRSSVQMILSNPIYCGRIVWNRKRRIKKRNPTDKFREVPNPPEMWIDVQGLHEAIVTEEEWNEAQRIRSEHSHPPAFTGVIKNPYSGLVYCANCGAAIQRQYSNKKCGERLLCPTPNCTSSIKMDLFDERIESIIKETLANLKLREKEQTPNEKVDNTQNQIKAVQRRLQALSQQRNRLHDFLEQGIYDVNTFMERQNILTKKREDAEQELNQLNKTLSENSSKTDYIKAIPIMENILNTWNDLEPAEKNKVLKQIITKIIYKRENRTFIVTEFTAEVKWRF